jgi:hypothetical protein
MKVRFRKGMLVVMLPLIKPSRKSKSGKTLLVASSHGPRRTALRMDGKPVVVMLAAYIRPQGYVKKAKKQRKGQ